MARILLVDDDPDQLDIRRLLLETKGHTVHTAPSATEAAGAAARCEPDVVVMDLRLPRLEDGRLLIRRLRDSSVPLKIVVLSGSAAALSKLPEACLVDAVLAKPLRSETLLAEVSRVAGLA